MSLIGYVVFIHWLGFSVKKMYFFHVKILLLVNLYIFMFYPIAGDLGFNHEEMTGISILFQLLYHNPKVLYSPNVTAVRDIISKVS